MKDVHTEHCCIIHGCKYGDEDCTVTNLIAKQSFPCETCSIYGEGDMKSINAIWNKRKGLSKKPVEEERTITMLVAICPECGAALKDVHAFGIDYECPACDYAY